VSLNGVAVEFNIVPDSSDIVLGSGGGIYNLGGTLLLRNSTIRGNVALWQGGGIFNDGPLTIFNSTISGNVNSGGGAGIYHAANDLVIVNSTISDNTVTGLTSSEGGEIFSSSRGDITIIASTIADNRSTRGGGIFLLVEGVGLLGTILANNTGGDCDGENGQIDSLGFNLIENANCTIFGDTTTNKTGQDPQLQPLGDNGGPTQTRKLLGVSPAIDMWPNCSEGTDQRRATSARSSASPARWNARCSAAALRLTCRPSRSRCSLFSGWRSPEQRCS